MKQEKFNEITKAKISQVLKAIDRTDNELINEIGEHTGDLQLIFAARSAFATNIVLSCFEVLMSMVENEHKKRILDRIMGDLTREYERLYEEDKKKK